MGLLNDEKFQLHPPFDEIKIPKNVSKKRRFALKVWKIRNWREIIPNIFSISVTNLKVQIHPEIFLGTCFAN
jgi:hypothetical protein